MTFFTSSIYILFFTSSILFSNFTSSIFNFATAKTKNKPKQAIQKQAKRAKHDASVNMNHEKENAGISAPLAKHAKALTKPKEPRPRDPQDKRPQETQTEGIIYSCVLLHFGSNTLAIKP